MEKMRKGMMSMLVNIRKHLVSNNIAKRVTYNGTNSKKYIVIHETANTRAGADANAHARLQASGNSRQASWHYTVDDKEIVQSFEDNAQCWHAGNKYYNENSIGMEICVNEDGNFKKAVENAAAPTRHLMRKYNIPESRVIQHNAASGKNCPANIRSGKKGITWADFKRMLRENKTETKPQPKQQTVAKQTQSKPVYTGNSIVDYLNSIGVDSSFANRKKLAEKHGIKNYKGTAAQNLQLLRILRDGAKPVGNVKKTSSKSTTTTKKKTIAQMADEIIHGLHGNGHEQRRKSLGIDKATYEKVRAEVNRRLTGKSTIKKPTKSISQMADEVIRGLHGNGHEQRRKSLGIDKATYEKVRAEVNRRLRK